MNKKKLWVVIGSLMIGGTETFLVRLLSSLAKRQWTIQVFTLSYQVGDLAEELRNQGVTVTPILDEKDYQKWRSYPKWIERFMRIASCIFRLSSYLKKEKNAILHLFLPEAYLLGMFAARLAGFSGAKVMSRRSLNNYQKKRPVVAWLEKKIHHDTHCIVGNSQQVVEQLKKEGIEDKKIKLIYNGLNSEFMSDAAIKTEKSEKLTFIIVANLIPYKGHRDLLEAFSLIKAELQEPWQLLCIGRDQGIQKNLEEQVSRFKLEENVVWLGQKKDVIQWLQKANIGLSCSHEEGFSNSILECMAAGLPMIVTDVGGNAEAVVHEKTGYVVPIKDPYALSRAIIKLSSNKKIMAEFGEAAKLRVKMHFSLENCVSQHVALYQSLDMV